MSDAPLHIERTGTFQLPCPPEESLALLSPEGERSWVPGWAPVYLHPAEPSAAPGTVFRTNHNAQDTLWLVLEFDPVAGRARYGRFTEGSHIGTVAVECRPHESGTMVRVTYALTSTTAAGTRLLQAMHEQAYAAMLDEWKRLILGRG